MLNKIVSYINWYLGELNNYDFQFEDDKGDCVKMINFGLWCDVFCFNIFYVICF